MTYDKAIRKVNNDAYDALRAALKVKQDQFVIDKLKEIVAITDDLVER